MRQTVLTLLCALGLGACATPEPQQICTPEMPLADVTYRCEDGQTVRIKWWSETVEVMRAGQIWCLPHARSGSGARYADDTHEIWEHQGVVRVTDANRVSTVCRKTLPE